MEAIMLLVVGAVNAVCFWVGARVGMAAGRTEKRLPVLPDPLKTVHSRRQSREEQVRQDRLDAILRNLESYNGTPAGQEDIA